MEETIYTLNDLRNASEVGKNDRSVQTLVSETQSIAT